MNTLRLILLALVCLSTSAPAWAQPVQSGPQLSSSVETGWTSNAPGTAGGQGDHYVTSTHTIALAGGSDTVGLRASIGLEQTRYLTHGALDTWLGTLALDAETALSETSRLRGRFSLAYGQEGDVLLTPLGPLGTVTPALTGRAGLRYETLVDAARLGLSLGIDIGRPGDTRVQAGLLAPARTEAATETVSVGLELAVPIAPGATLSSALEWQSLSVSPQDQAMYGRLPAHTLRAAAGVEIGDGGGTALALRGGIDALIPAVEGLDTIVLPHARAEGNLDILPQLALRASLSAGVDIADPADLYADWLLAARAGLLITPAEGLEIDAHLLANQRRSAALDTTIETETGAALLAQAHLGGVTLGARLAYRYVTGLAPSFDETRIGFRVSASL